jgi:hypothetical protein
MIKKRIIAIEEAYPKRKGLMENAREYKYWTMVSVLKRGPPRVITYVWSNTMRPAIVDVITLNPSTGRICGRVIFLN